MNISDKRLYNWIQFQRRQYNKGRLSEEKIKLLEDIPGWTWAKKISEIWNVGYNKLKEYGRADVAQHFKMDDGYELGIWINNQRKLCKRKDRRQLLEAIPGWKWKVLAVKWNDAYAKLKAFGRANIPRSYVTEDGYKLGEWVTRQRASCIANQRRRKLLEAIPGWTWDKTYLNESVKKGIVTRSNRTWEKGFNELKKHGTGDVLQGFVTKDGYNLGNWVRLQRRTCNDPHRRKKLESIPDWTWKARRGPKPKKN